MKSQTEHTDKLAWRLRVYPRAMFASLLLAFVAFTVTADPAGPEGVRLGGDLPAFLSAGQLLNEGRASELYVWKAQEEVQARHFGTGLLPYVYPPFVAQAYRPLALVPVRLAYVLHSLALVGALFAAVWVLRPALPRLGDHWVELACALAVFYPMLRAVFGAQNSPVTVLLLALAWRARHERHEFGAGVALGLILYKPQLAVPAILVFLFAGRWAFLAGVGAVAAAYFIVSVPIGGWDWPLWWLYQAVGFHTMDQALNAANSVGFLGWFEAILGAGNRAALVIGWACSATLLAWLLWTWKKDHDNLTYRMGLLAATTVLVAPHSMFYEAGITGLSLVALAELGQRAVLWPVTALWAFGFAGAASKILGFNPLFLVTLATLGALIWVEYGRSLGVRHAVQR